MPTFNEQLHNDLWLHHTRINRYAAGTAKDAYNRIIATEREIKLLIMEYSELLAGVAIISKRGKRLLAELETKIKELRSEAWNEYIREAQKEIAEVSKIDAKAQVDIYNNIFPFAVGVTPLPAAVITSILLNKPFEGRTYRQWMSSAMRADIDRVTRAVKIGMVNGETVEEIVTRAIGTRKLKYKDGASRRFKKDVETNVITVVNGISNTIGSQISAANDDIIAFEVFQATLDIRTTKVCAGNDNKRFKVGEGPIPPLHPRCRSKRLPVVTDEAFNKRGMDASFENQLVSEFAKERGLGVIRLRKDLPYGTKTAYNTWARKRRRELMGEVPANQSFSDWMRKQSVEFQNEYFGIAKAKLFRDGKIPLDKFTTRDGYELTVAQLKQLAT